jgi:hypothetical protein
MRWTAVANSFMLMHCTYIVVWLNFPQYRERRSGLQIEGVLAYFMHLNRQNALEGTSNTFLQQKKCALEVKYEC